MEMLFHVSRNLLLTYIPSGLYWLSTEPDSNPQPQTARLYAQFMQKVETLAAQKNLDNFLAADNAADLPKCIHLLQLRPWCQTDLKPRQERYAILSGELL